MHRHNCIRSLSVALVSSALAPMAEAAPEDSGAEALRACWRLLRVESADWHATSGTLTLWERDTAGGAWRRKGRAIPVQLGRSGLRWGRGWHTMPRKALRKREGDGCSPAGIFSLDFAFGSMPAHKSGTKRWPWRRMTARHAGVDDPRSRHYNRIVDAARVPRDWSSAESMVPKSGVYRRGVVVRHNWAQVPGGGSCIFLHIRSGRRTPTAGCTAMAERDLVRILAWLDPARKPLLAQLPRAEWESRGTAWGLPGSASPDHAEKTTKNAPKGR
jgi:L,D-peptidoglycan transpeptidase YkuD (ErfK/YbiS/YcfS/YnhG family)